MLTLGILAGRGVVARSEFDAVARSEFDLAVKVAKIFLVFLTKRESRSSESQRRVDASSE